MQEPNSENKQNRVQSPCWALQASPRNTSKELYSPLWQLERVYIVKNYAADFNSTWQSGNQNCKGDGRTGPALGDTASFVILNGYFLSYIVQRPLL